MTSIINKLNSLLTMVEPDLKEKESSGQKLSPSNSQNFDQDEQSSSDESSSGSSQSSDSQESLSSSEVTSSGGRRTSQRSQSYESGRGYSRGSNSTETSHYPSQQGDQPTQDYLLDRLKFNVANHESQMRHVKRAVIQQIFKEHQVVRSKHYQHIDNFFWDNSFFQLLRMQVDNQTVHEMIRSMKFQKFKKGERVYTYGAQSVDCYFVISGKVLMKGLKSETVHFKNNVEFIKHLSPIQKDVIWEKLSNGQRAKEVCKRFSAGLIDESLIEKAMWIHDLDFLYEQDKPSSSPDTTSRLSQSRLGSSRLSQRKSTEDYKISTPAKAEVVVPDPEPFDITIHSFEEKMTYKARSHFGELALIHSRGRTTTAVCVRDTQLLTLSKEVYQRLIQKSIKRDLLSRTEFLKKFTFFQNMGNYALERMLKDFKQKKCNRGQVIYSIGQEPDGVYLIQSGEFEVSYPAMLDVTENISTLPCDPKARFSLLRQHRTQADKSQKTVKLAILGAGETFGIEECQHRPGKPDTDGVIHEITPRQYTVTCLSPNSSVLFISHADLAEKMLDINTERDIKMELAIKNHFNNVRINEQHRTLTVGKTHLETIDEEQSSLTRIPKLMAITDYVKEKYDTEYYRLIIQNMHEREFEAMLENGDDYIRRTLRNNRILSKRFTKKYTKPKLDKNEPVYQHAVSKIFEDKISPSKNISISFHKDSIQDASLFSQIQQQPSTQETSYMLTRAFEKSPGKHRQTNEVLLNQEELLKELNENSFNQAKKSFHLDGALTQRSYQGAVQENTGSENQHSIIPWATPQPSERQPVNPVLSSNNYSEQSVVNAQRVDRMQNKTRPLNIPINLQTIQYSNEGVETINKSTSRPQIDSNRVAEPAPGKVDARFVDARAPPQLSLPIKSDESASFAEKIAFVVEDRPEIKTQDGYVESQIHNIESQEQTIEEEKMPSRPKSQESHQKADHNRASVKKIGFFQDVKQPDNIKMQTVAVGKLGNKQSSPYRKINEDLELDLKEVHPNKTELGSNESISDSLNGRKKFNEIEGLENVDPSDHSEDFATAQVSIGQIQKHFGDNMQSVFAESSFLDSLGRVPLNDDLSGQHVFIPSARNPRFGKGMKKRRGTAQSDQQKKKPPSIRKFSGLPSIISPRSPGEPTYYPKSGNALLEQSEQMQDNQDMAQNLPYLSPQAAGAATELIQTFLANPRVPISAQQFLMIQQRYDLKPQEAYQLLIQQISFQKMMFQPPTAATVVKVSHSSYTSHVRQKREEVIHFRNELMRRFSNLRAKKEIKLRMRDVKAQTEQRKSQQAKKSAV